MAKPAGNSWRTGALAAAVCALGWAGDASAKTEAIIVTATGLPQARDESGQAITLIDSAAIDRSQGQTVADLLATTPSVRINANGGLGSVTSLSLRGAEAGQTLVLIDGVRINDPSSTSDAVDFGNLLAGNIRRIEVLRGSNAVAYGSDAIGGVINLSTHDPDEPEGLAGRVSAEGGYAGTLSGAADVGLRRDDLRVDLGFAGLRSTGISSAASRFGATERDGVRNLTGHAAITLPLSDAVTLDLRGYAIDSRLDYDSFLGTPADSSDTSHFMQFTGYAGLTARGSGGRLENRLAVTILSNRRDYRFMPDSPPAFGYRGDQWRLDYHGRFKLDALATVQWGLSHDAPGYRFFGFGSDERHSAWMDGGFVMAMLHPGADLTLTGGVRHDVHSQFGGITTFGANANWGLGEGRTRLRLAYGEGFRAPSLYQLHDSYSGNPALQPERARSFDLGVDRSFAAGKGRLSLTLFARSTRNQIDFDVMTFAYENLARALAHGVEFNIDLRSIKDCMIAFGYSLVDTRDKSPGSEEYDQHLSRRPVNSFNLSLYRGWRGGLSTGATLRVVGGARDPTAPSGALHGYALLGLRTSLAVRNGIELYARLDNAFNARYETSYGYSTYGRSAYGGVRMTW